MRRVVLGLALGVLLVASSACGSSGDAGTDQPSPVGRTPSRSPGALGQVGGGTDGATSDVTVTGPTGSDASNGDHGGRGDDPDEMGDQGEASGSESDDGDGGAAEDDLRTFAYATTDEATLAAEVTALGETVLALEADLQARDLDAAEADARMLLDQAETLETDARAAEDRQRPLEPEDADLVDARKHALDAFGLTADYAASVTAVADAVLEGRISDLPALLQEAADLAGTSDDVTQAYIDLNAELVAWAEAHPAEVARALATYGVE